MIYGGIPIIHKSYSQQRNTTISSVENATQIPDANTVNKPYLSVTMQTIKDPEGYGSTGERYNPTNGSVTVLVNESGKQRIDQHPLFAVCDEAQRHVRGVEQFHHPGAG